MNLGEDFCCVSSVILSCSSDFCGYSYVFEVPGTENWLDELLGGTSAGVDINSFAVKFALYSFCYSLLLPWPLASKFLLDSN